MSHSPGSANASKVSQEEYVRQWYALEELVREGESFSGKERNCAFLNTGDGRFADVSGALGFDHPEDARSLAVSDWDEDGDLDVWVRNRNAVGLRLLRNDLPDSSSTLSLHLTGTRSNRDAIGARVTLDLAGEPARKLVKTLHAGEGFRGQSTKWLHFGLEEARAIRALSVRWPDGTIEPFAGARAGKRWELVEGSGVAREIVPGRRGLVVSPAETEVPAPSGIARILVMSQPPAPSMIYTDASGASVDAAASLATGRGDAAARPLLVNLFATWCTPCAMELKEFGEKRAAIEAAGVDILALSLDALRPASAGSDANSVDPAAFLKRLGYAGASGAASAELLERVQIVVQQIVDNRRALPVPTSILLTKEGRVGVIYLGRMSVATLLRDVQVLAGPERERWNHLTDLKGRWHLQPEPMSVAAIAEAMRKAGHEDEARRYGAAAMAQEADMRNAQASRLMDEGRAEEAEQLLRAVLSTSPDHASALTNLGICLLTRGATAEAEQALARSAELDPSSGLTQLRLAHALKLQGRSSEAMPRVREAVRLMPRSREATLWLAWLLVLEPAADERTRREALTLARAAQALEGSPAAHDVSVLAAAQAANGLHAEAARTERKAIELARQQSPELVPELERRLALYDAGKPFAPR